MYLCYLLRQLISLISLITSFPSLSLSIFLFILFFRAFSLYLLSFSLLFHLSILPLPFIFSSFSLSTSHNSPAKSFFPLLSASSSLLSRLLPRLLIPLSALSLTIFNQYFPRERSPHGAPLEAPSNPLGTFAQVSLTRLSYNFITNFISHQTFPFAKLSPFLPSPLVCQSLSFSHFVSACLFLSFSVCLLVCVRARVCFFPLFYFYVCVLVASPSLSLSRLLRHPSPPSSFCLTFHSHFMIPFALSVRLAICR